MLSPVNYLTASSVLDGRSSFPAPSKVFDPSNYETGHVGHGAVRITYIKCHFHMQIIYPQNYSSPNNDCFPQLVRNFNYH